MIHTIAYLNIQSRRNVLIYYFREQIILIAKIIFVFDFINLTEVL